MSIFNNIVSTVLAIIGIIFMIEYETTPQEFRFSGYMILIYLGWTIGLWK